MAERPGTITSQPPRIAPADHPYAVQFQTTHSDADRTATPHPDADTKQFTLDAEYLPEAPPGYNLLRNLGSGGMGTVYLAFEHATERNVAIKFLHSPTSGTAFDRFLIEVRALAELKHENIINVLDVKTTWREPYFTMDFANGGTLSNLTKPDRLPTPIEAARLMQCAANAIAAAHAKDIIHRDIKPSNILLFENASDSAETPLVYSPRVSDFGLAKRLDRGADLTRTGPLGTPCYMSPEAAAGRSKELTATTDIYGLGATLFHLLAGRPPFTGESNDEIIKKVLNEEPPRLRSLRPEVPPGLEAIAMKALEKDPAARYASANAFAADLGRFLAGVGQEAPLLSRRRRARRWLVRNRKPAAMWTGVVLIVATIFIVGLAMAPAPKANPSPDPIAAHLANVKADLAAGKPVALLGETGLPKYSKYWLEKGTLGELPDRTCAAFAFDTCLVELAPDLGLDRYRIELEMKHLKGKSSTDPQQIDMDSVGFYFAHSTTTRGDTSTHACFVVMYKDYELPPVAKKRPNGRAVNLSRLGFVQDLNGHVERLGYANNDALEFTPKQNANGPLRADAGDWRPIVAEITSEEIHIQWRADKLRPEDPDRMVTLARWSGDKTRSLYEKLKSDIYRSVPSAEGGLQEWSPRMPFGVLAYRSSVAIRNVRITPIP